MVVTRHVSEAAAALSVPCEARGILTDLDYDPVIVEWHLNWQCFEETAEAKIWALKICGWLQYKYPDGPAW
jgi:hypothetical protein